MKFYGRSRNDDKEFMGKIEAMEQEVDKLSQEASAIAEAGEGETRARDRLFSVEDPLHEDDWEGFAQITKKSRIMVVGDDLLVTNPQRVRKAIEMKACNAVLVKPNQIGTVTETLEVIELAKKSGWNYIISHRSGETTDTFISHLAFGIGAPFMKAGAPCRGERTAKYNELLRLEELI